MNIPTNAYFIPVNLSSSFKTFTLPVVSSNPGRVIVFKDAFGNALTSSIRFSTVGLDRIERSTTSTLALSNTFGAWTFINDGITTWSITEAYLNSLFILPAFTPLPPRTWSTYARSDGTASVTSAGATFTATIVGPNNGGGFGYAYVFSFFTTSGTLSLIFNYSSSDGQPYDWGFYNVTTANPAGRTSAPNGHRGLSSRSNRALPTVRWALAWTRSACWV